MIVSATGTVDHGNGTQRVFVSWSGNVSSDRSRIELTMSAPQMISATYRTEYELVITSERGSVGGRKWFSAGERIKILVSREIVEGEVRYLFVKWEGAIQTESNEATVTMDAPRSVTAIWKTQYRITLAVSGVPNGTSVSVMINGQENQGSAPYSFSGWFDSGSKLAFETAVTIETVTYEYSLEGWRNSAGEWVTSPRVLNGPATLRTIYVSRPKGLLNYLISAFGTDKLSEIILLKNARDSILSKTFSGRHLVYYFDVACHTMLPNFASQLSNSPATKTLFILTVYPLMKALAVPAMLFEFGVPMTDFSFLISSLIGAFLIGLIYLFPVLALLAYLTRKRAPNLINRSLKPLLIIWIVSVQMVIFAEIVSAPLMVAAATLSYLGLGATLSAALATLLLTRIVQISNRNEATYSSWNTKSLSENAYACSTQ